MSFELSPKTIISGAAAFVALITAYKCYDIVPPKSYAVHIRFGQLVTDHAGPGVYPKSPLFDSFYPFNNNTVIWEDTAGSGRNTADQNSFTAELRLHYKVDPNSGYLVLKLDDMEGDNGASLIKSYLDQSVNAVVGARNASDTLADAPGFLQALLGNLQWRLAQNNVPVALDTIEYLTGCVGGCGDNNTAAGLREPIQMRIKSNGVIENMAGPAAIAVGHGFAITAPALLAPQYTPVPMPRITGPTTSTTPRPNDTVVAP